MFVLDGFSEASTSNWNWEGKTTGGRHLSIGTVTKTLQLSCRSIRIFQIKLPTQFLLLTRKKFVQTQVPPGQKVRYVKI